MTFEEMQKVVRFAKASRLKSLSLDGLAFEFFERGPRKKRVSKSAEPEHMAPPPPKPITLDDINKFIYDQHEDVSNETN
jgi:hypothetical protein